MKVGRIAIGSTNPVKIGAVRDALKKLYPSAKFVGVEVESGVTKQPMSDEETMRGARNRARAALKRLKADIGVGLEGGVIETSEGMMNTVWCSLVTKNGIEGISGGSHFMLPPIFGQRIKQGKEIAEVLDELMEEKDIRSKQGIIGVLTKNLTSRREEYAQLVKMATMRLVSPELYK